MKQQLITKGIILARTNFQEADRILTLITADYGKITVIAKGSRRSRSKLAGGIELFSVNEIAYMPGRGEIGTLASSRLIQNFGMIIKDMDRTMYAYRVLKQCNKITEQAADSAFFDTLASTLKGLNDLDLPLIAVEIWLGLRLLDITGHMPDFQTEARGMPLESGRHYEFSFDDMHFIAQDDGPFTTNHIKLLRVAAGMESPLALKRVMGSNNLFPESVRFVRLLTRQLLHL